MPHDQDLVLDDTFTHAFWFTAVFTVVSTVLINVLAFGHCAAAYPRHPGHQHLPYHLLYA